MCGIGVRWQRNHWNVIESRNRIIYIYGTTDFLQRAKVIHWRKDIAFNKWAEDMGGKKYYLELEFQKAHEHKMD